MRPKHLVEIEVAFQMKGNHKKATFEQRAKTAQPPIRQNGDVASEIESFNDALSGRVKRFDTREELLQIAG